MAVRRGRLSGAGREVRRASPDSESGRETRLTVGVTSVATDGHASRANAGSCTIRPYSWIQQRFMARYSLGAIYIVASCPLISAFRHYSGVVPGFRLQLRSTVD